METTKKVVDLAKKNGLKNIEGEIGYLRGESSLQEAVEIKEEDLTDPKQAEEFIKKTGVTSLAVAIGNIHGVIKKGIIAPHVHFAIPVGGGFNNRTKLFLAFP